MKITLLQGYVLLFCKCCYEPMLPKRIQVHSEYMYLQRTDLPAEEF